MIRKSFHIDEKLLSKAQDQAKLIGIPTNTFIRLAVEEKVHSETGKTEQLLKVLEQAIEDLKKQTVNLQLEITEETMALSKHIKEKTQESWNTQEQLTKRVIQMVLNREAEEEKPAPSSTNKGTDKAVHTYDK